MSKLEGYERTAVFLFAADTPATLPSPGLSVRVVIALLALGTLLAIAAWFLMPSLFRRWRNSRQRLFSVLCRTHHVGRRGRRLLSQAARALKLPHPTHLFLAPEKIQLLLDDPRWQSQHEQLRELSQRMFDGNAKAN